MLAEYWSTYSVRILRNGGDGRSRVLGHGRAHFRKCGGEEQRRCPSYYWAQLMRVPDAEWEMPRAVAECALFWKREDIRGLKELYDRGRGREGPVCVSDVVDNSGDGVRVIIC